MTEYERALGLTWSVASRRSAQSLARVGAEHEDDSTTINNSKWVY